MESSRKMSGFWDRRAGIFLLCIVGLTGSVRDDVPHGSTFGARAPPPTFPTRNSESQGPMAYHHRQTQGAPPSVPRYPGPVPSAPLHRQPRFASSQNVETTHSGESPVSPARTQYRSSYIPSWNTTWGDLAQANKDEIFQGLARLYMKKILPLEEMYKYGYFHSPSLTSSDFMAKPMVLVLGQYSVGKTSFIRSLLGRDFPGQRIGPEPTTDRFTALMYGNDEREIPGHALAMQEDKPFRGLATFGNNFLSKFSSVQLAAPILSNVTIIDTPGVLSGEKQRIGRDYDYTLVIRWFAERADMIIVMFDAHKLDISDELRGILDVIRPHQEKIRILLNKADAIDTQQLMRVYGALMWSLGKVIQTPEVCRVYVGSFWEHALQNTENQALLEREKADLINELMALPANAAVRRINELVKRARSVKVHAFIIHYLRKQIPYVLGRKEKQAELIRHLEQNFLECSRRYGLPLGDFPPVESFRERLREFSDLVRFPKLDKSLVVEMDKVISTDIPKLLGKAQRAPAALKYAEHDYAYDTTQGLYYKYL